MTNNIPGQRGVALALLIERRCYGVDSPDWQYRTRAAWMHIQAAMGKPANAWTNTPPRVTVRLCKASLSYLHGRVIA